MAGALVAAPCGPIGCEDDEPEPRVVRPHLSADPRLAKVDPRCRAKCKMAGLCGYSAEAERCVARGDEGCEKSDACRTRGLCTRDGARCVGSSEEACRRSEQCAASGACSFSGNPLRPCVADSHEDCRASERCRRRGACSAVSGECRVASDEDCARSKLCERDGACSAVRRGGRTVCRARSDADCEGSVACAEEERCRAIDGYCR